MQMQNRNIYKEGDYIYFKMVEKKGLYVFGFLLIVFSISIVSAGFSDWFTSITGNSANQPTNVSAAILGTTQAQIIFVSPISATTPIEATTVNVTFNVHMKDTDGVADLNDTSVMANLSRTGETRRVSGICALANDIDTTTANYSCSVYMWYWDGNGDWNVTVLGNDLGNLSWASNISTIFTYNLLRAMVIAPPALTWASLSVGATNQTSNNDPTIVNNTGNYNSSINVTAINLIGETTPSYVLPANNFTISRTTGGAECIGSAMVNATARTVIGTVANRGNLSVGSGSGQENLYYCIPFVPIIPTQTYSTAAGGSWTISYP